VNWELVQLPSGHQRSSRQHHCPQTVWVSATPSQHAAEGTRRVSVMEDT